MALIQADRVKETASAPGTGAVTLISAVSTGFQRFSSVMVTSDVCYYTIADQSGSNWEVGIGTYSGVNTLTRTTILASSNSGSVVNFTSGTQDVFITYPALTAVPRGRAIINNMVYGI
jgi:hypothetical protein